MNLSNRFLKIIMLTNKFILFFLFILGVFYIDASLLRTPYIMLLLIILFGLISLQSTLFCIFLLVVLGIVYELFVGFMISLSGFLFMMIFIYLYSTYVLSGSYKSNIRKKLEKKISSIHLLSQYPISGIILLSFFRKISFFDISFYAGIFAVKPYKFIFSSIMAYLLFSLYLVLGRIIILSSQGVSQSLSLMVIIISGLFFIVPFFLRPSFKN